MVSVCRGPCTQGIYSTHKFFFLTPYALLQFIYEGLSHMNEEQEKQLRDHLASKAMFSGLERFVVL